MASCQAFTSLYAQAHSEIMFTHASAHTLPADVTSTTYLRRRSLALDSEMHCRYYRPPTVLFTMDVMYVEK